MERRFFVGSSLPYERFRAKWTPVRVKASITGMRQVVPICAALRGVCDGLAMCVVVLSRRSCACRR
jgi:hypothetical protein